MSFNNPKMTDESGNQTIRRYTHQPITIEHYGYHAKIQENGRVVITGQAQKVAGEEIEYDEIEIPASLIFKIAQFLKATRQVKYVAVAEVKPEDKE